MKKWRKTFDWNPNTNLRDKQNSLDYYVDGMLNKTITMFKYNGLPESLPERELELILQVNGYGIVTEHNGELVALWGGWAPPNDVYYRPTKVIVANPWANINKEYEIGTECVLVRNDPLNRGLIPILERYGALLTEADITLLNAAINMRAIDVIAANTDNERRSAEAFLAKIEEGTLGVLCGDEFTMSEGKMVTLPYASGLSGYITQVIELEQYLRGTFLNEIGLNANYNMKRERLSSNETELNEDCLRPLIDSMLEERQKAVEKINEMYGTNITVEFNSSWSKYNESDSILDETGEDRIMTWEEHVAHEGELARENELARAAYEESVESDEIVEDDSEIINDESESEEVIETVVEEVIEEIAEIVEEIISKEDEEDEPISTES